MSSLSVGLSLPSIHWCSR